MSEVEAKLNISKGNDKIGNMLNISFPIHYTCNHCAECYKSKLCYGLNGCFCFTDNQIRYAENLKFFIENDIETVVSALTEIIKAFPKNKSFRWFAIGDIHSMKMLLIMQLTAQRNPDVDFFAYTKKYNLVNRFLDINGKFADNLNVMFSLWTDNNGNVIKAHNPHNLVTTIFIPYGKENMLTNEMFICPCSNGAWIGKCTDCKGCIFPIYKTVAFLEHSTGNTKQRDKEIRETRKQSKNKKRGKKWKT